MFSFWSIELIWKWLCINCGINTALYMASQQVHVRRCSDGRDKDVVPMLACWGGFHSLLSGLFPLCMLIFLVEGSFAMKI